MVKQVYDQTKTLQTNMTADVNGIYVFYNNLGGFTYEFEVMIGDSFACRTCEEADEAIKDVIATFIEQSRSEHFHWEVEHRTKGYFNQELLLFTVRVDFKIVYDGLD